MVCVSFGVWCAAVHNEMGERLQTADISLPTGGRAFSWPISFLNLSFDVSCVNAMEDVSNYESAIGKPTGVAMG